MAVASGIPKRHDHITNNLSTHIKPQSTNNYWGNWGMLRMGKIVVFLGEKYSNWISNTSPRRI